MRYGIDIDGVIADFNTAFTREVNNIWPGRVPINYEPPDWNYGGVLTKDEVNQVWAVIEKKPNWWLSIQPYPDNLRAIALHRIRHPEDEIFYVTARHEVEGMPTMHQSQVWLEQCGIAGLGTAVIVDTVGDKSAIFNALECDANVDDRLETVIDHVARTRGAFLLDRLWNKRGRPSTMPVVSNLEEFFIETRRAKIARVWYRSNTGH